MSAVGPADLRWLDSAVRLARPVLGSTGEQPAVGALIVDEQLQLVFGRGVTGPGGGPHAIHEAIADARSSARGRTLYLTLEPHGTGARSCIDAIVAAGLARVVLGCLDPDKAAAGAAVARLKAARIAVAIAEHAGSAALHEGHICRFRRLRPFVNARLAVSRDGMIGLRDRRVTLLGEPAERWSQALRARADAVMVGARTARLDDPDLMVRLAGFRRHMHLRVVVAGAEPLGPELDLIGWVSGYPTVVIAEAGAQLHLPPSVQLMEVTSRKGRPDLGEALQLLARRGVATVLVEGGARLTESLLGGELVDRFHLLEVDQVVGRGGVPASVLGTLEARLGAGGFVEVDRRQLGADKLRTFEKEF